MSNPTTTPSAADDIAYVLGLPVDRQSAVCAALLRHLAKDGKRAGVSETGGSAGWLRSLVDALKPEMPERVNRPLPPDIDPSDPNNWATNEELDALTAAARARRT
jgi:hypothetical protein